MSIDLSAYVRPDTCAVDIAEIFPVAAEIIRCNKMSYFGQCALEAMRDNDGIIHILRDDAAGCPVHEVEA